MKLLKEFLKSTKGQALVEYGVIVAMLSIAAITIMTTAGGNLNNTYNSIDEVNFGDKDNGKWIPKAVLKDGTLTFICDELSVEEYKTKHPEAKWVCEALLNTNVEYKNYPLGVYRTENVSLFCFYYGEDSPEYEKVHFDASFKFANVQSMSYWFAQSKVATVTGLEDVNPAYLTNLSGMFFKCENLESIDMNGLNTSNVTMMNGMFANCSNLTTV